VNAEIVSALERLLDASARDGVALCGWGYRSSQAQIDLRRAHCGDSEYDIYEKPSYECSPPTAPPGSSMHEQGLAVDFTYDGSIISTRSSPAYQWLDANAASYGLYNLPSEPWHWSTNGD
jgi:LAS superfamily LD-carboxypeptidase LdcB